MFAYNQYKNVHRRGFLIKNNILKKKKLINLLVYNNKDNRKKNICTRLDDICGSLIIFLINFNECFINYKKNKKK